jgi:type III secretory pathway component EscU
MLMILQMWQQIIMEFLKYYGKQAIILMFGIVVVSVTEHWFQRAYASNLMKIFKGAVKNIHFMKRCLPTIRLI